MQYFQDVLTLTVTATTVFDAFDLIGFDDGKITTNDAPVKGFAKHPATEVGMDVGVVVLGTGRVKAVGAIAKGALVKTAAAGGVQTAGAEPANPFARALTAAADGEFVTILIR
mgnify:CR=1 FL=1|tara:strand:- start:15569 stop:15907 length:339 start_codon:yes stop_codon:yes gene_type:complete